MSFHGDDGPVWPARYDGVCRECDEPIREDDMICHGDSGGYVHEECR
jgi:hypothetical protein